MTSEALNQKFLNIPRSALVVSAILHAAVPLMFLTIQGLERMGITILPRKRQDLREVYQNYIQVDVVGLPDLPMSAAQDIDATLPEVANPKALEKGESVIPEVKPEMEVESEEARKKEEADKLSLAVEQKAREVKEAKEAEKAEKQRQRAEQERALKKLEEEAKREAAVKALQGKGDKAGRKTLRGNITSKGTSVAGAIGTSRDRYTALVAQRIKQNFNIFPWQKKKGLVSVVYIEITGAGRLKTKRIVRGSRDQVFDGVVLQAVEASQPFPVPEDLSLIADGITIEFRPEE